MNLLALRERFPHMGKFSGYDMLFKKMASKPGLFLSTVNRSCGKLKIPILRKIYEKKSHKYAHTIYYDISCFEAEALALMIFRSNYFSCLHYAYLENNLSTKFLSGKKNGKIIATAHQPEMWWKNNNQDPGIVKGLDHLIVLDKKSKTFFSKYLQPEKIHFIPHGVDTNFFKPGLNILKKEFSGVFSGHWLRDLTCLKEVIDILIATKPEIKFSLIYPEEKRKNNDLVSRLVEYSQVKIYSGLSDTELLTVYQNSSLLFLPLLDCTANNAVLEAMSCGLPVISTNVGGLRDYCSDKAGQFFENDDFDGISKAILKLYYDQNLLQTMSVQARKEAVENLDWKVIANQTIEVYKK